MTLMDVPFTLADVEREESRREACAAAKSLAAYVRYIWPVIEPGTPLVWNWHLDLICDRLERVSDGDIDQLVICVPPGTMKSILVSVAWPTWEWLYQPHLRGLYISNDDDLVKRDSRRCRDILESEEYRLVQEAAHDLFGVEPWKLAEDQNEKHYFANTRQGFRQCFSIGAKVTGKRGDKLVIDDPVDAKSVVVGTPDQITKRMTEVQYVYDHVLSSRLNDKRSNPRVVIMQRLHRRDLAGMLIDRGVEHVVLPMEYDPDHPNLCPDDPRTEPGELLFPDRFPSEVIDEIKSSPGANRHYQSQYQQKPSDEDGGVIRREWFRYYTDEQVADKRYYVLQQAGGKQRRVLQSDCWRVIFADLALTERTYSDYTVMQVWDVEKAVDKDGEATGQAMMLLHQWRARAEAPVVEDELEKAIKRWNAMWVAIENKHYGMAVIQRFRRNGLPVRELEADRDKVSRAMMASVWMEAEKVYFPQAAPWLGELEDELLAFPQGEHDDQVDTTAYAINYSNAKNFWREPKREIKLSAIDKHLGMDKILFQKAEDKASPFALDRKR